MLSDAELLLWFQRLEIPSQTQAIINHIRSSGPTRRVGGGRRNVSGRYPSRKMGFTVQFESHRVELAEIYCMEHDAAILEYYDQPPSIKLDYRSAAGKRIAPLHTADFFVIRRDGAGWTECKTEEELRRLAEQSPHRYVFRDGSWRCPPGEEYARPLGLDYTLRSAQEIDWVFQANILFLEDYFDRKAGVCSKASELILAQVSALPGITLQQLVDTLGESCRGDDIYTLIAQKRLHVDLHAARLTEPNKVTVFPNESAAASSFPTLQFSTTHLEQVAAGRTIQWDSRSWQLIQIDNMTATLLRDDAVRVELPRRVYDQFIKERRITEKGRNALPSPSTTVVEAIAKASENDLREANRRFACVCEGLRGQGDPSNIPTRTLRRWISKYQMAERTYGSGFLGLLPASSQRGNRTSRLPAKTARLLADALENDYESIKQKSRRICWLGLQRKCEQEGALAPSYKTFCLAVRQRSGFNQTLKREGHRAAYRQESFYWELDMKTPHHGERPFEIAHIDHTELDVELVCSISGRRLGRPWVTILMDAFSRRCLAAYLTFDNPSSCSCMMVLRECVYRHARLPQILVVDGGREFESIYFETLLARYHCTKKSRPPAKSRFGSVCERLFGTTNSQFVHNLKGNTQATRNVREITKGIDPKRQAVWSLQDLREHLQHYLYEVYDTMDHPALGRAPCEMYGQGLAATGSRTHRGITYDREFYICTLPSTRKGSARVDATRGIKVHYLNYWCEAFRRPGVAGQSVEVRYDPFDIGTVYAFVDRLWTECHSEYFGTFHGRSWKEMMLAAEEVRKRHRDHSGSFALRARSLAEFLDATEMRESVLTQRLKDLASRSTSSASAEVDIAAPAVTNHEHTGHVKNDAPDTTNYTVEIYGEF